MSQYVIQNKKLEFYPSRYSFLLWLLFFLVLFLLYIYINIVYEILFLKVIETLKVSFVFFYSIFFLGLYSIFYYRKTIPKKITIDKENIIFEFSKKESFILKTIEFSYFGLVNFQRKDNYLYLFLYNKNKNIFLSLIQMDQRKKQEVINFLKNMGMKFWNEENPDKFLVDEYNLFEITKNNYLFFDSKEKKLKILIKSSKYIVGKFFILFSLILFLFLLKEEFFSIISKNKIDQIYSLFGILFSFLILIIFLWFLLKSIYNSFFDIEIEKNEQFVYIYKIFVIKFIPIRYLYKKYIIDQNFSTFLKIYLDRKVSKIEFWDSNVLSLLNTQNYNLIENILNRFKLKNQLFEIDLFGKKINEIYNLYIQINQLIL